MSGTPLTRREALTHTAALAAAGSASVHAAPAPPGPTYPDDAFSRPHVDLRPHFITLNGVAPEFDIRTRRAHFHANELRLEGSGSALRTVWRFNARDRDTACLVIEERIRRAPESVAFRVRNLSSVPLRVGMDLHELAWMPVRENVARAWTLGEGETVPPGAERTVVLPFAATAAQEAGAGRPPRFPFIAAVLVVRGVIAGSPCSLELSDLTVRYAHARGGTVRAITAPPDLIAGSAARIGVQVDGALAQDPVDLEVRRGDCVLWRIRLTDRERASLAAGSAAVARSVPWWIPPGPVAIGLTAGGYRVDGPETRSRIANARTPRLPRSERRLHHGRPTLFVDGRPFAWQGYSSYDYQPGSVAEFGAHGATVMCVPVCAGRHVHAGVAAPTWVTPGRSDFREIDERVCFSLQANPNAVIFLRVSLGMPAFWAQEHAAELAQVRDGRDAFAWCEGNAYPAPSLASEAWRHDQERALVALMRYCRRQPWAERLAGVWLTGEVTEEWFAWGCNDGFAGDYSGPMEARFRRECGVATPPPETRSAPGRDLYPPTGSGRAAAAYQAFASRIAADTIAHFAGVVKRETGARVLAGAFYGYVLQLTGEPRQATAGNFALRRLLDCPQVDFVGGIPLHDFRDLTNGYNAYVTAWESVFAAGKLHCCENDLFSWLHPIVWHNEYDARDPRGSAIQMHRRECAGDAVRGAMAQKFSLAASWHHDAALQDEFARQAAAGARAITVDRTSAAQIAFMVDDTSLAWTPPETALAGLCSKRLLYRLARTGAPVGVWLLSDIHRLPPGIRLVVVAHAPAPDPADLDRLRRAIEAGGRTFVVVGIPGAVDPSSGARSPEAPARTLGLPIAVDEAGGPGRLMDAGGRVVMEAPALRPRGIARDAGAYRYADGAPASAKRALARGGRLLWFGAPPASTPLLCTLAREAGVHPVAPPEFFVHASRELAAVTSPFAGTFPLEWPEAVTWTDWFDGWSARGARIEVAFTAGQTRLFHLRR